ncbi:hypothetical protein CF327_g3645 [Tilletia walkeri]|nr:hypothetical protein CF327_g3645 [Tilletia walkeri]
MPRAERNAIESLLETLIPAPIIDVLSALGRFVYAIVFSRNIDPESWTATLVPPLISLLLAYASLVVAYRTVRNTFSLALFGVKYGALIGALIAIYSWWSGEADGVRGLAGALGGAAGGGGGGANAGGLGGMLGGGADLLHTLGRLGQGGGAAAIPLLSALLGQVGQGGAQRNQPNTNNNPRRSTRLRTNNNNNNRRRARPAPAQPYPYPAPDLDYIPDELDDDDDDLFDGGGAGDDTAIKAVKHVLRWLTHATDPEPNRRAPATNPLFPQSGSSGRSSSSSSSNSRRRRRRRASSSLSDID